MPKAYLSLIKHMVNNQNLNHRNNTFYNELEKCNLKESKLKNNFDSFYNDYKKNCGYYFNKNNKEQLAFIKSYSDNLANFLLENSKEDCCKIIDIIFNDKDDFESFIKYIGTVTADSNISKLKGTNIINNKYQMMSKNKKLNFKIISKAADYNFLIQYDIQYYIVCNEHDKLFFKLCNCIDIIFELDEYLISDNFTIANDTNVYNSILECLCFYLFLHELSYKLHNDQLFLDNIELYGKLVYCHTEYYAEILKCFNTIHSHNIDKNTIVDSTLLTNKNNVLLTKEEILSIKNVIKLIDNKINEYSSIIDDLESEYFINNNDNNSIVIGDTNTKLVPFGHVNDESIINFIKYISKKSFNDINTIDANTYMFILISTYYENLIDTSPKSNYKLTEMLQICDEPDFCKYSTDYKYYTTIFNKSGSKDFILNIKNTSRNNSHDSIKSLKNKSINNSLISDIKLEKLMTIDCDKYTINYFTIFNYIFSNLLKILATKYTSLSDIDPKVIYDEMVQLCRLSSRMPKSYCNTIEYKENTLISDKFESNDTYSELYFHNSVTYKIIHNKGIDGILINNFVFITNNFSCRILFPTKKIINDAMNITSITNYLELFLSNKQVYKFNILDLITGNIETNMVSSPSSFNFQIKHLILQILYDFILHKELLLYKLCKNIWIKNNNWFNLHDKTAKLYYKYFGSYNNHITKSRALVNNILFYDNNEEHKVYIMLILKKNINYLLSTNELKSLYNTLTLLNNEIESLKNLIDT